MGRKIMSGTWQNIKPNMATIVALVVLCGTVLLAGAWGLNQVKAASGEAVKSHEQAAVKRVHPGAVDETQFVRFQLQLSKDISRELKAGFSEIKRHMRAYHPLQARRRPSPPRASASRRR